MEPLGTVFAGKPVSLDEFDRYLEEDGCAAVTGPDYCRNLFRLAETIDARNILEIGVGWGYSAYAFQASLSHRGILVGSGQLISVDPHEPLGPTQKVTGVQWTHVYRPSNRWMPDQGTVFDLLYIDGDPKQCLADTLRFMPYVRRRGLVVLDGYGCQETVNSAVEALRAKGYWFGALPYSPKYSHAVHLVGDQT